MSLPIIRRRGFTLVEILTALALLGILSIGFIKIITSQARFTERQMGLRNARTVSRNALNIMLTDLRMVQDFNGLLAATPDSVTARVPIAFGLLCSTSSGATMSLVPVDSAMVGLGQYAGWAYRDSVTGTFTYMDAANPTNAATLTLKNSLTSAVCEDSLVGPGILPVTAGSRATRLITVNESPTGSPKPGWPVFTYQIVTYKFGASTAYPGRRGLFRLVKTSASNTAIVDEIIAPFEAQARFRFYMLNADQAQDAAPALSDLNLVRGLEMNLAGSSPRVSQDQRLAYQALVTGVFFKNRRDP